MKKLILIALLFISCQTEQLEPVLEPIDNNVNVWTDGIIPFGFTDNVSQEHRNIILDAMATYESFLNVDYVEYSIEDLLNLEHGLLIKYTGAVQSSVYPIGMPEYIADFRVGDIRYFDESVALHELGHNLGRQHEQQVANALEHLKIDYDNIAEGWQGNFKVGETIFNTPFDYNSNMIYGSYDVAKDQSKPVMTDLEGKTFEPSKTLTELDKSKYIELYGKVSF